MTNNNLPVLDAEWLRDPVAAIGKIADLSAQEGFYGLQDANLLFAEAVNDLQSTPALPNGLMLDALLADWVGLNEKYLLDPTSAIQGIMAHLRRPDLNLPLADDEFAALERQLLQDAVISHDMVVPESIPVASPASKTVTFDLGHFLETIETLANLAADKGLFGLQDANLLLLESLSEITLTGFDDDFAAKLLAWPDWVSRCSEEPQLAITAMMDILRHPLLSVAMTDDEFAMLQAQLESEQVIADSDPTLSGLDHYTEKPEVMTEALVSVGSHAGVSESMIAITEELVGLMVLQTQRVRSHLAGIIVGDETSTRNGLRECQFEIGNFANASNTAGFVGLSRICLHIKNNLQVYLAELERFTAGHLELLLEWLDQVEEYLPLYHDSASAQLLISGLLDEQWPIPLSYGEMAECLLQIRSEGESVDDESEAQLIESTRKTIATLDDVSLALPDDVNQELLEVLLHELPTYAMLNF